MDEQILETEQKEQKKGLVFERRFTKQGQNPLNELEYEKRSCKIVEPDGSIVFEMDSIEVPKSWSQLASDILISKYIRKAGVPETGHETSAKQVVYRIGHSLRQFGEEHGYFATKEDADIFEAELLSLLINQKMAFNSPVWFNCGLYHQYGIATGRAALFAWDFDKKEIVQTANSYIRPQCSACFIQSLDDDLMSIFELVKNEAKLFKYGSGTGSNFSKLRGRQEKLSGGGYSSGLMSFLEVFDRAAGATKSGGTTRRAAKMVCLDMDHPEIVDFINWKVKEEKKVKVLIDAGYSADFNGEAYHTVAGQNANNSVRITDKFMNAVLSNSKWQTIKRLTGEVCEELDAKELMDQICFAAWACADPGVQFDTIINDWHTCPNSGKINSSNPCSEYMFLDDSACNLASVNLCKFLDDDGNFDIEGFRYACKITFTAQEIIVDFAAYPTKPIAHNSHLFRPIGLGYANIGAMLMRKGIPYDSEKSFAIAGAITAIISAAGYQTSAEIAEIKGPFIEFEKNRDSMLRVMKKHRDKAYNLDVRHCPKDLLDGARKDWDKVVEMGEKFGFRNAQATLLAPTGTIGLLMDCDTTGVEPDFALVKYKKLAGGGYFKIINQSMPIALKNLGYNEEERKQIIDYVLGHATLEGAPHIDPDKLKELGFSYEQIKEAEETIKNANNFDDWTPHINPKSMKKLGLSDQQIKEAEIHINGAQTVEGCPVVKKEHLAVFDCANKCGIGDRFIEPMGHIKFMAATQPFISGSMSKTVNLPNNATVNDINNIYFEAWRMGLKCVALYRDGCKLSQPLNIKAEEKEGEELVELKGAKELPKKRKGIITEINISGHKVCLRTGEYEDGNIGELLVNMHKEGSPFGTLMNCFSKAVTMGLQHGIPLKKFVDNFIFTRFEPAGMTDHPNVRTCTSVVDFIFRVLAMEYLGETDIVHVKPEGKTERVEISDKKEEKKTEEKTEKVEVKSYACAASEGTTTTTETVQTTTETAQGVDAMNKQLGEMMGDAPPCPECGHITVRSGACYKCLNCGNSLGCS